MYLPEDQVKFNAQVISFLTEKYPEFNFSPLLDEEFIVTKTFTSVKPTSTGDTVNYRFQGCLVKQRFGNVKVNLERFLLPHFVFEEKYQWTAQPAVPVKRPGILTTVVMTIRSVFEAAAGMGSNLR